jgi:hypothetical protein
MSFFYCIFNHFITDFAFTRDSLILNGLNAQLSLHLAFNDVCMQIRAKRKGKKNKNDLINS